MWLGGNNMTYRLDSVLKEIPKLPVSINQLQFTVGPLTSDIKSCHNKCVYEYVCVLGYVS